MKRIIYQFVFINLVFVIGIVFFNNFVFNCSSLYDRVSLDLSAVSIIVSLDLAVIIFVLETEREKKIEIDEIERAKSEIIYNIEESLCCSVFFHSDTLDDWPSKDIENVFKRTSFTLHKFLDNEEYKLLQKFIESIVDVREYKDRIGFSFFLKEYLRPIFLTNSSYIIDCAENYEYFNDNIVKLLDKLNNSYTYNPKSNHIINSKDGLSSIERIDDKRVRIIQDGLLLAGGIYKFDARGNAYFDEGYSELQNYYYKGEYKNRKFNGFGVYNENCLKFGSWSNNNLIDGIQRSVLVKYDPKVTSNVDSYLKYQIDISKLNEISILDEFIDSVEELNEYTNDSENYMLYVVDLVYQDRKKYIFEIYTIKEFESLLKNSNKISSAKG